MAEKYPAILGFNEPNRPKHNWPNKTIMEPEMAAAAWIEIQEMYPDKILVSPAPAGGSLDWFGPFFKVIF